MGRNHVKSKTKEERIMFFLELGLLKDEFTAYVSVTKTADLVAHSPVISKYLTFK
jgi:hypothetical protein